MLAALQFNDPLMLTGLLAAGIPVALHLLNRVRSPIVPFPTLRFLRLTAQKTARRRRVQQYVLLLVRCLVFALIAMAIARPLISGGSPTVAYGFVLLLLAGIGLLAAAILTAVSSNPAPASVNPSPASTPPFSNSQTPKLSNSRSPLRLATIAALILAGVVSLAGGSVGLGTDRYFSSTTGTFRGTATACVIILDNSHSMLIKQDSISRAAQAAEHARDILAQSIRPAEAAVLLTNPGSALPPDRLTTDLTAILGNITTSTTIGRARPMRDLVRDAAKLLDASDQPNHMLILDSDMARSAFADAETFASLRDAKRPIQVVLMSESEGTKPVDAGISDIAISQGVPVVGNDVVFDIHVVNNSDSQSVADLQLLLDGSPIKGSATQVQLDAADLAGNATGGAKTVKLNWRPDSPGPHRLTAALSAADDAANWNNQRDLIINVAEQIKVLVVGPEEKIRARTAAYYVNAALDPFGGAGAKDAQGRPAWSVAPSYQGIAALGNGAGLGNYSAAFFCDVPRISPALATALQKYVDSGGRIVWLLGPSVDRVTYNNELAGARELLPAALAPPETSAAGASVDYVDLTSPILGNLFDTQEPFREIVVTGRWPLANPSAMRGHALSKLADGAVWITEHSIGKGDIYTFLSAPSGDWTNLGTKVVMVPIMHRMAVGDAGRAKQPSAYEPGDHVIISTKAASIDVKTPAGQTINARPTPSGDFNFTETLKEGQYTWTSVDKKSAGSFIINPPAEEIDVTPADIEALAKDAHTTAGPAAIIAPTPAALRARLDQTAEGTSLIPGLLAFVVILALIEALLANRQIPSRTRANQAVPV